MSEFSRLNGYDVKDKKAIRYYDTIADMIADTNLKEGMYVETKGYYSSGDGGNGQYEIVSGSYTDDGGSIIALDNDLYCKLIVSDIVNVRQFGAYGDGIHDDTDKIQACINYAHDNGLEVIINPSNNPYLTTLPILVKANHGSAGGYNGKNGTVISGTQAGKCVINKVGNSKLAGDNINATFICRDEDPKGTGVIIKNLVIYNRTSLNDEVVYTDQDALCIYNEIPNSTFDNLFIRSYNGICSNSFNCIYSNLNIQFGGNTTSAPTLDNLLAYGLKIYNSTSSNLNAILSYGSGIAYDITSFYTNINNCFASAYINFKVDGSGLVFNGCGSENKKTRYQFYTASDQSNFIVDGYYCYRQLGDSENNISVNDTAFCCCKNAMRVSLKNIQILNGDKTGIDSNNTGYIFDITDTPYTPTYTSIDCIDYYPAGDINTNMRLWNHPPKVRDPQKLITPTEDFMYYYWNGKIYPFIGGQFSQRADNIVNFLNTQDKGKSHTIWLDSTTRNQSSQGFIDGGYQHFNLGDIMLNNDPKTYNLGMRVITEYTDDNNYVASNIPIVLSGNTASRPSSNQYVGLCYFDTSLKKPIWWNGTAWVDSTGTSV